MVVGLGNPGAKYERTRHNMGFWVVEALLRREPKRWSEPRMCRWKDAGSVIRAWVAPEKRECPSAVLMKPMDFMNLSGPPVAAAAKRFGSDPAGILVVCDDADLTWGKLRMRASGSSGGQKGLRSIIESLGTESFARLRVGIGRPEKGREAVLSDFVLENLSEKEGSEASALADRAADACRAWLDEGIEFAMNRFNGQNEGFKTEERA